MIIVEYGVKPLVDKSLRERKVVSGIAIDRSRQYVFNAASRADCIRAKVPLDIRHTAWLCALG